MSFDPDAYLATPAPASAAPAFDPDAYLASAGSGGAAFDPDAYLAQPVMPEFRAAEEPGLVSRVVTATREALSPLIGETGDQRLRREQDQARFAEQFPGVAAAADTREAELARARQQGGALFAGVGQLATPPPLMPQIPMIPAQEGKVAQVAAGAVNAVSGVVNMLPTPLGVAGAMGGAPGLAVLGLGAPSMVRAGAEGVETLRSDEATLQEKAAAGAGLAILAGGAALGAREIAGRRAPQVVTPEPGTPFAKPRSGPIVDAEIVGDPGARGPAAEALPEGGAAPLELLPPRDMSRDLARITGGRVPQLEGGAPAMPPAPPTLLALPEGAAAHLEAEAPESVVATASAPNEWGDLPVAVADTSQSPAGVGAPLSPPRHLPAPGSLGAAAGMDSWRQVQKMLAPESLLPTEFRTATRYSDEAQRSIIQRGGMIQGDLRRAMAGVRKVAPTIEGDVMAFMTGQAPLTSLPGSVRYPAQRARALVDELSERAIREGVVKGDLATSFADNLGSYLRRSYRLFADPDYVPDPTTKTAAVDFVRNNWNPKGPLSRAEAETVVNQLLDRPAASQMMQGGKIAGRDVSSLMRRKDLAPEIRALYGEITDPLEAFGQTVPRLARLVENHAAQQWIKLVGLKQGLFSSSPDPLRHRQLVADASKPHEVWRGLYTTPELADAMTREVHSGRAEGVAEGLWRTYRTAVGVSKLSKTVLNPDGYAPNVIGGLVSAVANGNFNLLPLGRGLMLAAEELGALRAAGVLPQTRAGLQADVAKLTKLGLRGESLSGADLVQTWEKSLLPRFGKRVGRLIMPALKVYGAIDDTTKYMAWKSELARIQKWAPQLSLEAAERMAAERVRATMPTYSQIPDAVRKLSQLNIMPPFVAFTWEVFRNTYNTARLARRDMREGAAAGNAAQVRDGARRLASALAVIGAGIGYSLITRRENRITAEQDEAVRFFGPPWNRDAQLVYNSPVKDGRVQFSNSSYLLPHTLLTQALEAGLREDDPDKAAAAFARSFAGQFLDGDGGVLVGPILEAKTGVDRHTGRPIPQLNRESMKPALDALSYVYRMSFEPPAQSKFERIGMALRGETGAFGRTYSLGEEAARLAGVRAQSIDFNEAVKWKARDLGRRFVDASNIYTQMNRTGVKPEALEAAYGAAEASRRRVLGDVGDYLRLSAAVGVKEDRAIKALREANGLGAEVILGALEGRYVPQVRERGESMADAVERVGDLPAAEAMRETVRLATENPAFLRALVEAKRKQALGVTQRDELVLGLNARDGTRANYIRDRMREQPNQAARTAYLIDLARKGVLTEEIAIQMAGGARP